MYHLLITTASDVAIGNTNIVHSFETDMREMIEAVQY